MRTALATVGLLLSSLLAASGENDVLLTQCQCSAKSWPFEGANTVFTNLAPTSAVAFFCPEVKTNPAFPAEAGIAFSHNANTDDEHILTTAPGSFFNEAENMGDWFVHITLDQLDLTGLIGDKLVLFEILDTGRTFRVSIVPNFGSGSTVSLNHGAGSFTANIGTRSNGMKLSVLIGHTNTDGLGIFMQVKATNSAGTVTDSTGANGEIAAAFSTTDPLDIHIAQGVGQVLNGRLTGLKFGTHSGVGGDDFQALLEANEPAPVTVIPLPVTNPVVASIDEDTSATIDLTSFFTNLSQTLDFTVDVPETEGTSSSVVDNSFTFTPLPNANGDKTFSFTYTLGDNTDPTLSCVVPATTVDINVIAVPDAPELIPVDDLQVFAGIEFTTSDTTLVIAKDVDFLEDDDLLSDGVATITVLPDASKGTLFTDTTCNSEAAVNDELPIQSGQIQFCYQPTETMVEEATDSFSYTVKDGTGLFAAGTGTITFIGSNPLQVPEEDFPIITGTQGLSKIFQFSGSQFGSNAAGEGFDVKITDLPDSAFGVLNKGSIAVQVDDIVATNDDLTFIPASGFFNLGDGKNTDGIDGPIPKTCPTEVDNCPVRIGYKITSNGVDSAQGFLDLYFNAVDNKNPVITVPTAVTVPIGSPGRLSGNGVTVTSDNGNNIFPVTFTLAASGDVEFSWVVEAESTLFSGNLQDRLDLITTDDCRTQFCTSASVAGVPAIITELINTVTINRVNNGADAKLVLTVDADGDEVTAELNVEFEDATVRTPFLQKGNNKTYVISGGSALGVLLLAALACFMRSGSKKNPAGEEKMLDAPDEEVAVPLRGKNKKVGGNSSSALVSNSGGGGSAPINNKKSIKIDVDDAIFDWEKHIDKDSGEVYFFNPKTGESQWDPPSVKKYEL